MAINYDIPRDRNTHAAEQSSEEQPTIIAFEFYAFPDHQQEDFNLLYALRVRHVHFMFHVRVEELHSL